METRKKLAKTKNKNEKNLKKHLTNAKSVL